MIDGAVGPMIVSDDLKSVLNDLLDPWFQSLTDPKRSQKETLSTLLQGYAQTQYGKKYGADRITTIETFRSSFPVVDYVTLTSELEKVRSGDYHVILPEPVSRWVMTRGSTGEPKVIPATEKFLSQIFACGSRAIVNFALKKDPGVLESKVLNLNFPSEVYSMPESNSGERMYGYSSGTYAKLFPSLDKTGLVPLQEEIDTVGGGVSKKDWERRFDLVFSRAKDSNVGSVMGVTQVILAFARYIKKKYGVYPKETWKMKALFLTSVPKIHSKYGRILKHCYGEAPIVEMYTATEGVFAQQLDDLPYVVPNYDTYFFEVKMRNGGVKMLSELKPREWGSLVISSVLFPRYEIGDLVEAIGRGYFRIFGRKKRAAILEHILYNLMN